MIIIFHPFNSCESNLVSYYSAANQKNSIIEESD